MPRTHPNIAITGTPATGKTTLAKALTARLPALRPLDLAAEAARRSCRDAYDEALQSWIIDEDKLADSLREEVRAGEGGWVIDWMHADFWKDESEGGEEGEALDLVVTMRAENGVLCRRYEGRGYAEGKIQENLDAEIMDVVGGENRECFGEAGLVTVVELRGETGEDVERAVEGVVRWVERWRVVNGGEGVVNGDGGREQKAVPWEV